jgi:hypothetical protein
MRRSRPHHPVREKLALSVARYRRRRLRHFCESPLCAPQKRPSTIDEVT